MTFYHFVNCVALSYAPFHMTYKVRTACFGWPQACITVLLRFETNQAK